MWTSGKDWFGFNRETINESLKSITETAQTPDQLDEISKKLAKSYLDKSASEREENPVYNTREKFRSRMIGGATADAKLKGRVEEPYKLGFKARKSRVKIAATNEEVLDENKITPNEYHNTMLKALQKSRLPKDHKYTSAVALNGDFVVHNSGRVVARLPKGEHNITEEMIIESGILTEKLDAVGKETLDIDNDGDIDKTDSYLRNRRKIVGKAIKKEDVQLDERNSENKVKKDMFIAKSGADDTPIEGIKKGTFNKFKKLGRKHYKEETEILDERNDENKLKKDIHTVKTGAAADLSNLNYGKRDLKPLSSRAREDEYYDHDNQKGRANSLKNSLAKMKRAGRAEMKHGKDAGYIQTLNDFGKKVRKEEVDLEEDTFNLYTSIKSLIEIAMQSDLKDHEPRTVSGVKGVKSTPFKKKFKNQAHQDKWTDSDEYSNCEVHHIQKD